MRPGFPKDSPSNLAWLSPSVTEGLRDVSAYPAITRRLVEAGYSATDIAKIWGGNTLRVFRAAGVGAAVG